MSTPTFKNQGKITGIVNKTSCKGLRGKLRQAWRLALASVLSVGLVVVTMPVQANPAGGTVVSGSAVIDQSAPSTTTVTQSSDKAIIDWQSFNIGAGEQTNFVQPNSNSLTLNRVTGGEMSTILGRLTANGRIMLINSAGVLFGVGAKVDVGGLLATTADIENSDFMAGNYTFKQSTPATGGIINRGEITAKDNGLVALVAPGVENSGVIQANLGKVALAAGKSFTLDLYGDQLINLDASSVVTEKVKDEQGNAMKDGVRNSGSIIADGGKVLLTANAAKEVVDHAINMDGVIQAKGVATRNGEIILLGGNEGKVRVSGKMDVSGKAANQKGGIIKVLGNEVALVDNALFDASGDIGGGIILIGGSYQGKGVEQNAIKTVIEKDVTLNASALTVGDGGKVIVWSDGTTEYYGSIIAKGGAVSGNGGFVETSGHKVLVFKGAVDLTAPMGSKGVLLLDPEAIIIQTAGSTNTVSCGANCYADTGVTSILTVADLQAALATANVTVQTSGVGATDNSIHVNDAITWSSGTSLTLLANNNVYINAPITSINGGTLILNAANNIYPAAAVSVSNFILQNGNWLQNAASLPAFTVTNNFQINGGTFSRFAGGAGTLVNPYLLTDVYGFQGVGTSASLMSASYRLNNTINASSTVNWNSGNGFKLINSFSGDFDGNGFAISNLKFIDVNQLNIGIFRVNSGTIHNLNITNINGTYNSGPPLTGMGGLVGTNLGTINQVAISGNLAKNSPWDRPAAGLVGVNQGTISNSSSSATVGGDRYIGGLVGTNTNTGLITNSYSTGFVGGVTNVGGFVMDNYGTITNSYSLTTTRFSTIGAGFAVQNWGAIDNSYSAGPVIAGSNSSGIAAGFIGVNYDGALINHSYSTSLVFGGNLLNSFSGPNYGSILNSFVNSDINAPGMSTVQNAGTADISNLTTSALKTQSTYTAKGWDFSSIWNIIPGSSYPYLQWRFPTTPQVVSGHVYTNQGVTLSGVANNILLVSQGQQLINNYSVMTGYDGVYYALLDANSALSSQGLLAYVSSACVDIICGPGVRGNTIITSNGASTTNLDIYGSTLWAHGTGLTNAFLGSTKGSLIDSNIRYSVTGNDLTINTSGTSWLTSAGDSYLLNGNLTNSAGNTVFNGSLSVTSPSVISTTSGNITLNTLTNGNILTLLGGSGNNIFTVNNFDTNSIINGGTGTDTLNLAGNSSAVTVNLNNVTNMEQITGTVLTDNLIGANVAGNAWVISGTNNGTVNATTAFTSFENLIGGNISNSFNFTGSGSISGLLNGGSTNDTLTYAGYSSPATVNFTGINAGNGTGIGGGFISIENLVGSSHADIFNIYAGGGLAGTLNGGLGNDLLDYTNYGSAVAITLTGANAGSATGITGGFSSIENLTGSALTDTLTGNNAANVWNLTGADTGNITSNVAFAGFENLIGGTLADTFNMNAGGSLSGTLNGGSANDTINYTNYGSAVSITLTGANAGSATGIAGGFASIENLTGSALADSFSMNAGGSLLGILNGGSSNDLLDYINHGAPVAITLTGAYAGTATGITGGFSSIENLTGSTGNDTLTGNNAANTWNLTGADTGNITSNVAFTGFENLVGGTLVDIFAMNAGGSLSGTLNGGSSNDGLNYTNYGAAVTVNINGANSGTTTGIAGGFTSIENLTGSALADTFNMNAGSSLAGGINGSGGVNTLNYSNYNNAIGITTFGGNSASITGIGGGVGSIQNIIGSSFDDALSIGGFINGYFDGGAGNDLISYGGFTAYTATTITGLNSGVTTYINGGFLNVENMAGSVFGDLFFFNPGGSLSGYINGGMNINAPDYLGFNNYGSSVTFTVTGAGSGTVTGLGAGFQNMEALLGSAANDTFYINAGGSVSNVIAGQGGTDALSYINYNGPMAITITSAQAGVASGVASFNGIENLAGGAFSDTLTGNNAANTWNITGANAGNIAGNVTFSNFENLVGGTLVDTFNMNLGGNLSGSLNGGSSNDSLLYTSYGSAVTITLTGVNAGSATGITGGFSSIENLTGSAQADTFNMDAGGSLSGSLNGGSANDSLLYTNYGSAVTINLTGANSGTATGIMGGFSSIENLTGGAQADTFNMNSGGSLSGSLDGGSANDSLLYTNYGAPVAIALTGAYAGTATGIAGGFSSIENLTGSAGNDTLTGNNAANTWDINGANLGTIIGNVAFIGFENLVGGSLADMFNMNAGSSLSGTLNGGSANDSLLYTNYGAPVAITLTGAYAGSATGLTGGFSSIENLTGSAGNDTLTGNNAANTWDINGANLGTIIGNVAFIGFENLVGGSLADMFNMNAGSSLSGTLNGGSANDSLLYTNYGAPVAITLTGAYAGSATGLTGGFSSIENLTGSALTDTLIGNNAANTWDIMGANTGNITGNIVFTGFENLIGGSLADMFNMNAGSSLSGTLNGGSANDSLLYTNYGSAVTITLTGANAGSATGIAGGFASIENLTGSALADIFNMNAGGSLSGSLNGGSANDSLLYTSYGAPVAIILTGAYAGNATGITGGFSSIENLTGSALTDTLTGNNAANIWDITGANTGNITGNIAFTGFENLIGGSLADMFNMNAGGSLSGTLNGGSSNDSLLYTNYGAPVSITLTGADSGTATGIAGGFASIENLTGSALADTFNMGISGSISGLIDGGAGIDSLTAADAANIWNLTGADSGDVNSNGYIRIENIIGGSSTDDYTLGSGGSVSGLIDGGAGIDSLTAAGTANIWNLTGADSGDVNGNDYIRIENIIGGSSTDDFTLGSGGSVSGLIDSGAGIDTLTGSNGNDVWNINDVDSGDVNGSNFIQIENVSGGAGDDTFNLIDNGNISGVLEGGVGTDTLNGANNDNVWHITGPYSGDVNGTDFTSIENIEGGQGKDRFVIRDDGYMGFINGDPNEDTLDLTELPGFLIVDKDAGIAPGTGGFTNIENILLNDYTFDIIIKGERPTTIMDYGIPPSNDFGLVIDENGNTRQLASTDGAENQRGVAAGKGERMVEGNKRGNGLECVWAGILGTESADIVCNIGTGSHHISISQGEVGKASKLLGGTVLGLLAALLLWRHRSKWLGLLVYAKWSKAAAVTAVKEQKKRRIKKKIKGL